MKEEEKSIQSHGAGAWAAVAAMDVNAKSAAAYERFRDFFDNPEHGARVDAARKILDDFFKVKDLYENQRTGMGRPFTVLKVTNQVFPRVSSAEKERCYRKPLADLGVEIVFSKGTNSYLYRIY